MRIIALGAGANIYFKSLRINHKEGNEPKHSQIAYSDEIESEMCVKP
jgi:hypothetical protein